MLVSFYAILILFFILLFMLVGCKEEQGIYISESCLLYENEIYESIDKLNELEGYEVIWVEGTTDSVFKSRQENINDDIDAFYCWEVSGEYFGGETSRNRGDIYLYVVNGRESRLPCIIVHELGHRYLGFGHIDDPEAIMYPGLPLNCLDRERWI